MFSPKPHSRLAVLALLAMGTGPTFAQSDNFDDGNDAGWTRYTPLAPFGGGARYSFPDGRYRIEGAPSPAPELVGQQRAGSLRADQTYTRTRVAVDITAWSTEMNQSVGLVARITQLGLGTTQGYTFNYNSISGFHQLNLVLNEAPARAINESVCKLDPTHTYRLVFTAVDNSVLGQVFASTNLTVPLHSVFGLDDMHPSGNAGVFVYALNATGAIDARFDNYEASPPPAQVRATLLTLKPRPDEQPAEPIDAVIVRLADLETSARPETIRLEVDGARVEPLGIDGTLPTTTVTWMPSSPLAADQPHRGKVTFSDETGPQVFEWRFGAPAPAAVITLVVASRPEGPYTIETAAVHDEAMRQFTVPVRSQPQFFRTQDGVARTLKVTSLGTGKAVLGYE